MSFLTKSILLVVALAVLLQSLIPEAAECSNEDIRKLSSGLNIIVTGANSGVGYATVEHLVRAGTANAVILACRNMDKCNAAKQRALAHLPPNNDSVTQVLTQQLDLANRASIERFAQDLPMNSVLLAQPNGGNNSTDFAKIDVLLNNAGIFASSNARSYRDGVEEHMYINHLSHVYLTHLLWPHLTRSKARIVSVSSISAILPLEPAQGWLDSHNLWHDFHFMFDGLFPYARSKRANLLHAFELHRRFSNDGISSVASHPGYARTEIWTNGAKIFPDWMGRHIRSNRLFSMSSAEGALTQVWAAIDRQNIPSGWYAGPQWWLLGHPMPLGPILDSANNYFNWPPHFWPFSLHEGERLWDRSLKALEISEFGSP